MLTWEAVQRVVSTMVEWIVPPAGMIEPAPAPEFYVDDVGAIEHIGSNVRIYFCAMQLPLEAGCIAPQKIVQVRIVRPVCAIPGAIIRLASCLTSERSPDVSFRPPFKPRVVG